MKPRFSQAVVRGSPIEAGGRVFVPEARVTALAAGEASFVGNRIGVMGFRIERVTPVALIEQTPDGERRHPIEDAAGRARLKMIVVALLAPLVLNTLAGRLGANRRR